MPSMPPSERSSHTTPYCQLDFALAIEHIIVSPILLAGSSGMDLQNGDR